VDIVGEWLESEGDEGSEMGWVWIWVNVWNLRV